MKRLSFINKVIFLINNVFALLLLLSFILPYIKPTAIATASVIGLFTPALILGNIVFVVYWLIIGLKKQFFLSFLILCIGYFIIPPIYKFSSEKESNDKNQLSILSYNVRKFNIYNWIDDDKIPVEIASFIKNEKPDVVILQEYKPNSRFTINYPYSYYHKDYNYYKKVYIPSGLIIFSKYPIINSGALSRAKFTTSIVYNDLLINNDTVRIYNFHLNSLGIKAEKNNLGSNDSNKLINQIKHSFKIQELEVNLLVKNIDSVKHKTILAGDMNNTPYSWAYKNLKNNLNDTFLQAGKGFGRTYNFKGFPLRIDYIFADPSFDVLQHKNYDVKYSDHYPIMATLSF